MLDDLLAKWCWWVARMQWKQARLQLCLCWPECPQQQAAKMLTSSSSDCIWQHWNILMLSQLRDSSEVLDASKPLSLETINSSIASEVQMMIDSYTLISAECVTDVKCLGLGWQVQLRYSLFRLSLWYLFDESLFDVLKQLTMPWLTAFTGKWMWA